MKRLFRGIMLMLGYESVYYAHKRQELRLKLHRIFTVDAVEGQIDCLVRSALGHEKRHRVLSR